ncbi:hypothetical protein [Kitasatospora sp. NRRL B-11411]|uniref:hypothetical protein n=1 Tax=Kitasatospora sp. NRRL B-11411 TaxID=1463822 RepID=UPI0004C31A56|nr:hypothetical protein [Kitasatospora sp. NRRL B-11411]
MQNVIAIRLQPGETVTVNPSPEPEPADGKREEFDFLGHTFYLASRELSARLPFLGLTATEYDVWHTMLGAQLKGGIVPITVSKLAERLGIGRKETGEALILMPPHIPEIHLPEGDVRPPRRTRRSKLEPL